jgi:hypothetical protein
MGNSTVRPTTKTWPPKDNVTASGRRVRAVLSLRIGSSMIASLRLNRVFKDPRA